jgi:deoxyribodipyrimidine photolyase
LALAKPGFAPKSLNDFTAANNGGWQWPRPLVATRSPISASSTDVAKRKKFDAQGVHPALCSLTGCSLPDAKRLHAFDCEATRELAAGVVMGRDYPFVVKHDEARALTLERYAV